MDSNSSAILATYEARISEIKMDLAQLGARLDWWEQRRALFVEHHAEVSEPTRSDPDAALPTALPDPEGGRPTSSSQRDVKPTLPDAVVRVLLERPTTDGEEKEWRGRDIIAELRRRGWMSDGPHAEHAVWTAIGKLKRRRELVHTGYGTYVLDPRIRAYAESTGNAGLTEAARQTRAHANAQSSTSKQGVRMTRS